jgi:hypothetical protein
MDAVAGGIASNYFQQLAADYAKKEAEAGAGAGTAETHS